MTPRRLRRNAASAFGLGPVLMAVALAAGLHADDRQTDVEESRGDRWRTFLLERMREFRIAPASSTASTYELDETLLLRWTNPVSGTDGGCVYIWSDAGRPVVIAKCHVNESKSAWIHTLVSLAPGPLQATKDGRRIWAPAEPGLTFHSPVDVPPPAGSERLRFAQIRQIARRFDVSGVWGEDDPSTWTFRLMPNPLYRYSSEPHGIVDGAILGYTQGTNPEVIVVIEAVQDPKTGTLSWRFAATRLTRYAVTAKFGDQLIIDLPRLDNRPIDALSHHGFHKYAGDPLEINGLPLPTVER